MCVVFSGVLIADGERWTDGEGWITVDMSVLALISTQKQRSVDLSGGESPSLVQ